MKLTEREREVINQNLLALTTFLGEIIKIKIFKFLFRKPYKIFT